MKKKRGRPRKEKAAKNPGRRGRPRKNPDDASSSVRVRAPHKRMGLNRIVVKDEDPGVIVIDGHLSGGLHITTSQVTALGSLVCCRECGEQVTIGVKPTTKGMISEFTVSCSVCEDNKSTNTPNLIRERVKSHHPMDNILQNSDNINVAHVAAFLNNGLGYSGLRHYCKYFNARCLNEATFTVYARQVISEVLKDTHESLLYAASIVREVYKSQMEVNGYADLTVAFTTTYHQWGSDFCLVAGAVIELNTGLVLDYDVANMYCHVCKVNAKKIVQMTPSEMTEWFNKHQDTCEIREWCDELDHDTEDNVKEVEPKYLECFIAKKIWKRSIQKYGFRYATLIHESDEKIHEELCKANIYENMPIFIDSVTSCFSRRKSEHARTSFQTKLKARCPRERVQTKDRILYVYAMSVPEYNMFAISSNTKLRHLVKSMSDPEMECEEGNDGEEEGDDENPDQLYEIEEAVNMEENEDEDEADYEDNEEEGEGEAEAEREGEEEDEEEEEEEEEEEGEDEEEEEEEEEQDEEEDVQAKGLIKEKKENQEVELFADDAQAD